MPAPGQPAIDFDALARDIRVWARELGFAFSSAFEDAIVRGDKLSKVMQGLLQDITRIIARRTITEPLGNAVSAGLTSLGAGSWFDGIGSPAQKIATYKGVMKTRPSYVHAGFKIFFKEDVATGKRLITAKDALSLKPQPEYILFE